VLEFVKISNLAFVTLPQSCQIKAENRGTYNTKRKKKYMGRKSLLKIIKFETIFETLRFRELEHEI
jgi:hypothetical protein